MATLATRYYATITHHSSISLRADHRVVDVGNTLRAAKSAATREFGGGDFNDYVLVIFDRRAQFPGNFIGDGEPVAEPVARRRLDSRRWSKEGEW